MEKKTLKFLLQVRERDARVPVTLMFCEDEAPKGGCGLVRAAGQKGGSLPESLPSASPWPDTERLVPQSRTRQARVPARIGAEPWHRFARA